MNISTKQKQTHRHREQTVVAKEGGKGREGLGIWDQQMQTSIYGMDKQQDPTVWYRELHSISCDKA